MFALGIGGRGGGTKKINTEKVFKLQKTKRRITIGESE